jgi:hypothetical protein
MLYNCPPQASLGVVFFSLLLFISFLIPNIVAYSTGMPTSHLTLSALKYAVASDLNETWFSCSQNNTLGWLCASFWCRGQGFNLHFRKRNNTLVSDKFLAFWVSALSDIFALALISCSGESPFACSVSYAVQYVNTAPGPHFCGPLTLKEGTTITCALWNSSVF